MRAEAKDHLEEQLRELRLPAMRSSYAELARQAEREMYGYELVCAIKRVTGETLCFGEGCVYPLLHRLEQGKEPAIG